VLSPKTKCQSGTMSCPRRAPQAKMAAATHGGARNTTLEGGQEGGSGARAQPRTSCSKSQGSQWQSSACVPSARACGRRCSTAAALTGRSPRSRVAETRAARPRRRPRQSRARPPSSHVAAPTQRASSAEPQQRRGRRSQPRAAARKPKPPAKRTKVSRAHTRAQHSAPRRHTVLSPPAATSTEAAAAAGVRVHEERGRPRKIARAIGRRAATHARAPKLTRARVRSPQSIAAARKSMRP
jgi:hypothetical protein